MTRRQWTDEQRRAANRARQIRSRKRHLPGGEDETAPLARLNGLVNASAKAGLDRLAACVGVPRKALIERLVEDAELAICGPLEEPARAGDHAGGDQAPMPGHLSHGDELEA